MSANRNEDLQRKLASMPAPAPPPGLAEKIKADIPAQLNVGRAKGRPMLFTLRVAASILIVAIGAYAMLRVMSRPTEEPKTAAMSRPLAAAPPAIAAPQEAANSGAPEQALRSAPPPPATETPVATATPPIPALQEPTRRAKIAAVETPRPAPKEERAPEIAQGTAEAIEAEPSARIAAAAPAAAPPPAAGGALAMKTTNVAEQSARAADLAVARPEVEVTISPYSGRMILRVADRDAVVEGAQRLAPGLYATDKQTAVIRLHEVERTVRRADARPWNDASEAMKQAVTKAERPE